MKDEENIKIYQDKKELTDPFEYNQEDILQ